MALSNSHHHHHHHVALFSSPGMGHIIPSLELAKHLLTHQKITITKITLFIPSINSSSSKAEKDVLQSTINQNISIDIIHLPPIDISNHISNNVLDPNNIVTLETKIAITMHEAPKLFVSAISNMKFKPTMIITDYFLSQTLPLVKKMNNMEVPMYLFAPTSAWLVALGFHSPKLDKEVEGEYHSHGETPILIPGCKGIHPSDLFQMMEDRTHRLYLEYLLMCEALTLADGIFVNTFEELEPKTLEALRSGKITKVPIFPIGPVIRETNEQNRNHVVDWLDIQEEESVIYVSLGSGYSMSHEQIKEMAIGLELSGQKFVWSLRPPSTKTGNNNYYLTAGEDAETNKKCHSSVQEASTQMDIEKINVDDLILKSKSSKTNGATKSQEPSDFPEEFYRIQSNGIVVMDWAPQLEILNHASIGGFVSHCGWNSIIESVSCGVPIIGWPLFAEQRMNASMLQDEEVGIAIRLNVSMSTKIVGSEEIGKAIRKIIDKGDIEGCAIRKRVKELKHIAQKAWSHHHGSSYFALTRIINSNGVS
ncbi:anthocyanidin 3-O-glucosyltransferase 5 [Arachis hypogaea]|uniref:Glycosyltransferase n=1 Tax=Arachis hypogaea TaxID=3818 RepID=A0A445E9U4_ARAHY|nr:Anthocyanidin 3-O-glucosyltransferase [Arachis hypogaea]RYR72221.1 hypothetical protein Ahy_A02g006427 [Arachis hypogaea]